MENENYLPAALRNPSIYYTPTFRGSKASPFSGDAWKNGAAWSPELDELFASTYDLMVQLHRSSLVVFDCDVKAKTDYIRQPDGSAMLGTVITGDGKHDLRKWLADNGITLPPTLIVETPGRPDGSHLPGWHLYYRQNPRWPIRRDVSKTPNFEVKPYWVRYWSDFRILADIEIAELPEDIAMAIFTPAASARGVQRGDRRLDWKELSTISGLNDFYALVKATWMKKHELSDGDEDEIDQAIRAFNAALKNPMDEERLNSTVCRKGWVK